MEIHLIEDRIRELCEKAVTTDDTDVPALLSELRALLAQHSGSVRYLAAKTLNRVAQEPSAGPSSSKAAD